MAKAVVAAAFLIAPAFGGFATPFSPDPEIGEAGSVRASLLSNTFQTNPPQSEPALRHPWVARLETSVASRLAIEAALSDGIGIGVKAAIVREADGPLDLALGFDDLLHSSDRTLFGVTDSSQLVASGRAWIGAAQTWEFVRVRATLSAEPTSDSWNLVPWLGFETAFKLPFSLGWEARYEEGVLRQSAGVSLEWKPFRIAGGLSELQSWVLRDWTIGWYPDPPRDIRNGVDNPGWWVAAYLDIPNFVKKVSTETRPVSTLCPSPVQDVQPSGSVAELFQQHLLREEVAELAVRAKSDTGTDPTTMAVLRRRILSGGKSARVSLWKIGLDTATALDERIQAVVTLSNAVELADTSALEALSRDRAPQLRREAAMGLGRIGNGPCHQMLQTLALDPEESVRETAKAMLKSR